MHTKVITSVELDLELAIQKVALQFVSLNVF